MSLPVFSIYLDKRKLVSYTILAFVLGSFLGGAMWNFAGIYIPEIPPSDLLFTSSMVKFSSSEQLANFIETSSQNYYFDYVTKSGGISIIRRSFFAESASSATAADSLGSVPPGPEDYSGTNVQVEGVDEADLVKTDGNYIYLVSDETVYIVRAFPAEEAEIVAAFEPRLRVTELYVSGDKLVAIHAPDYYYFWYDWDIAPPEEEQAIRTIAFVYDISDRSQPVLEREVGVDGYYTSSRMMGDYVYLIASLPALLNITDPILPGIRDGNETCIIEPTDVWFVNSTDNNYGYTNIVALNVQDLEEEVTSETYLMGSSSNVYASLNNIYLTSMEWVFKHDVGWETTTVYKISVEEGAIEMVAEGTVPGRVLNQFSMDERGDHFRIATTSGQVSRSGGGTSNNLYVLNSTMGIAGRLEGLAPGEDIYSARFMGERCYLVTFKKVDPLFVIDLADPENPTVLGKLKIPGYSDYLHPYDENTLIGIGKETIEAEEGNFAWYQGVKVSLFDVSDVSDPKELAKFEIGDRGTDSPALYNHKAFLFSLSRNLLVIPVLEAQIDSSDYGSEVPDNAYGDYVYQGAYIFDISREEGIELRGRVTHIDDPQTFLRSGYWFESDLSVERSLYIEDTLYTISGGMIKMNGLDDLSEIGRVELP
jgi:uncharacterized secreted protein with C-terminal beta-propeller domain